MRITTLLTVAIGLAVMMPTPAGAKEKIDDPRGLVIYSCSRCHAADQYYLSDRSLKAWQLTVKRMQSYHYDAAESFTDKEGDAIAKYLAANPFSDAAYRPRATPVAGAVGTVVATQPASAPAPVRMTVAAPPLGPRSPARATFLAKVMGYIAAGVLLAMVVTGLARRRIGPIFRKIHGVLAFVFCGSLTVHAAVFLAEYGAPGVLWLWFGIIATIILLSSEFTGLLKLQNRKLFVKAHIAAGVTGLVLTALHWVWIYI